MGSSNKRLYTYMGKSSSGKFIQGKIKATNIQWARHQLRRKGIKLQSLKKSWNLPFWGNQTIKANEITLFTQQLALLLKAGVPIRRCFTILAHSVKKPAFRQVILDINNDIYLGDSLAKALQNHPRLFNAIFCNMVEAGETSGTLIQILGRLAKYQQQDQSIKKRIRKALTYPFIVLIVALAVSAIMLTQVIPNFAKTYSKLSGELPYITQFVIDLSENFIQASPLILTSLLALIVIGKLMLRRSQQAVFFIDSLLIRLPLIGPLLRKIILGRFISTLATTISAGLPMVTALESSASSVNNRCYQTAISQIIEDVTSGLSLQRALGKQAIFPITLKQMVNVGEESGSLVSILEKAGQIFEQKVELALDTIIPLIEPVMMLILGILVGGLLVAMYLPVFQLGQIF
ncbi:MAG: type II secretion system F family protein [Cellvibrionales bacterium]|nr:type II secretion system F family protein [Cellvibrionales bacterium]